MNPLLSKHARFSACLLVTLLATAVPVSGATSWDGNRWFQIEVSIFTNETSDLEHQERFTPDRLTLDYPRRLQRLSAFADLFVIRDIEARLSGEVLLAGDSIDASNLAVTPDPRVQRLLTTGPLPRQPLLEFRMPDQARDAFLLLPVSQSDFLQSNRALERSGQNRLLFHGLWLQPVLNLSQATALLIEGGQLFNGEHELQGNLTIRFNNNQDRVVIDTDLWLIDFAAQKSNDLVWPAPPAHRLRNNTLQPPLADSFADRFVIDRIVQFNQSRDMRSNEFHYLDHPLMGVVISVKPYVLPLPGFTPGEN
ncbi:MAG: CsiV family protein [Pseudohongiellaceae bacterium]